MCRERSEQAPVGAKIIKLHFEEGSKPEFQVIVARDRLREQRFHILLSTLIKRHDQSILRLEVVIRSAHGYASVGRNLPHCGLVETSLTKRSKSRTENTGARVFRLTGCGRLAGCGPSGRVCPVGLAVC